MKKDFIKLENLSSKDIDHILETTTQIKHDAMHSSQLLVGKTIGLVFQKPSNRTRTSFEVGIYKMGGNCVYLGPEEINLGIRESTMDVAKTLSRYVDGIVARTHTHEDILLLAQHASVPVINGLCDLYHPCQALTDIYSIKEKFQTLKSIKVAYIGDGNNVCHSLLIGCAKMGIHMFVATPENYEPNNDIVGKARAIGQETGAQINISHDPVLAVTNAHVIYSDVWISMGQESEADQRISDFHNFQVNMDIVKQARDNYIFMHCLPAHRGQEVTSEIIDGPHSIIFDQAENRLHTQKAILNFIYHQW